ncbi:hypothetical protein [Maribellus maritimus]|uniref:hypothetical protein n=1 Tax=Maribellus maritimus TaxID=2870838 RepID=UPI001EECCA79|nr:hypothetical protein [Maribellus maritimus]MCG6190935.1 hypothetical protein [Maribellus maritimus]
MKYSIYIIAGLLLILWGVMVYGFKSPPRIVHLLIPLSGIIILLRILFNKKIKNIK